ncbi:MAG: hypothetical protein JNN28_04810 [Saprospiraceae bacterium]|nr:hypothetical protein [Saprospiraceae bacterium]
MATKNPSKDIPAQKPARRSTLDDLDLLTLQHESSLFWPTTLIVIRVLSGLLAIWIAIYAILLDNDLIALLRFWLVGLGILVSLSLFFWLKMLYRHFMIKKDVIGGIKIIKKLPIVHKSVVVKQQNKAKSQRFFVWIGGRRRKFRHEVDHSRYSRLNIGQTVTTEFAPHSNVRLKMHWYG